NEAAAAGLPAPTGPGTGGFNMVMPSGESTRPTTPVAARPPVGLPAAVPPAQPPAPTRPGTGGGNLVMPSEEPARPPTPVMVRPPVAVPAVPPAAPPSPRPPAPAKPPTGQVLPVVCADGSRAASLAQCRKTCPGGAIVPQGATCPPLVAPCADGSTAPTFAA